MRLARLAIAALCGAALPRLLGLPWDDAFASTIAVLPLVAVALTEIDRWTRRGRSPSPRQRTVGAVELLILVGLVALASQRARLGFTASEPLLLAGFLLLLARRVAAILLRLRPALGAHLPRRPAAAFFWLPLVVYVAVLPWNLDQRSPDGDEPYYLLLAHSLAHDFDVDLANNYAADDARAFLPRSIEPQPGDPRGENGAIFSRHNTLLPVLLALPYRVAGRWGAALTMAGFAAALCWWTLRLARHHHGHRPGGALLAYAVLAFAPPLLLYSNQVWVEVPAALFVAMALDAVLDRRWIEHPRRIAILFALLLPLVALPLLKARFLPIAATLALLAIWRQRGRRALLPGSVLLAATALTIGVNRWLFAKPFRVYSFSDLVPDRLSGMEVAGALLGPFFDVAFGLFAVAPIWLLLLPAAGLLAWRERRAAADLALLGLPYLLLLGSRREWYGGWSPPFRYGVVLLPLLALVLPPLLEDRRRGGARALLAALALLSFALLIAWTAVPGWTYSFADGSTHVLDRLSSRYGIDLIRFFPSFARPRAASWWWPLAAALGGLTWWLRLPPRLARPVGLAVLCSAFAALFVAGSMLPTRLAEAEDAWIRHPSGHVFPRPWTPDRTRYAGGWALRQGDRLEIPVVAGGSELSLLLRVDVRPVAKRRLILRLLAGERQLARRIFQQSDFDCTAVSFGPFEWRSGDRLALEVSPTRAVRKGAIIIDRAELDWR